MLTSAAAKAWDLRAHAKRLVPSSYVPTLVAGRVDRLWTNEQYRAGPLAQMQFLLEHTERAPEIPELAKKYAEYYLTRSYLRWHPAPLVRQQVRGIEWLTTRRDPRRSIVLNFMHHAKYEGLFASLAHLGVNIHILTSPLVLGPETPTSLKQHIRIVASGGHVLPAVGGTDKVVAQLRPGMIMAIASDVPGHTEVTFLGRRVLSSFGAALISTRSNSQVVQATAHRDGDSNYIQLHEPLEPRDFADPKDLLIEMLGRHAGPILAWPEAFDVPRARWGRLEE